MSKCCRAGIAALALWFVFGAAASYAAPKPESLKVKPGTLTGLVTDATGKALSNITLQVKLDGKLVTQAQSGENGKYVLENCRPAGSTCSSRRETAFQTDRR